VLFAWSQLALSTRSDAGATIAECPIEEGVVVSMSNLNSALEEPNHLRPSLGALLKQILLRLRRAAVRAIAPRGDYSTVRTLARRAGIRDISVAGDYGLIQGPLDDTAILATYMETKTWRPVVPQFFNQFFGDCTDGRFVDVGANIGLTTIPIAANPGVRCFSFEPDPDNFRYLQHNVETNCPHRNVRLFELALFDRTGSCEFRRSGRNKGDHHLDPEATEGSSGEWQAAPINVPTARLDDVLLGYLASATGPIGAKIIAQGAETHIVCGGRLALSLAGAMLIEIYPYGIARMHGDLASLLRFCTEHFQFAALNSGEHDDVLAWMPVEAATRQLADRYETAVKIHSSYFHLFLKK